MGNSLSISFEELGRQFRLSRLFIEDKDVKGTGWFHKRREDPLHIFGNCLRMLIILAFAPIYVLLPRVVINGISNFFKPSWLSNFATTPAAVLAVSPGDQKRGKYQASQLRPRYMLEVVIKNGEWTEPRQVGWSDNKDSHYLPYTALSYPMEAAETLYVEQGNTLPPKPADPRARRYDLETRKVIVGYFLDFYIAASVNEDPSDRIEYIWLDEYCLSRDGIKDEKVRDDQRKEELGCLADVFRGAKEVVVFCDKIQCDHTTQKCKWGRRLFTLSEIIYARHVRIMTRQSPQHCIFRHQEGNGFRKDIQRQAEVDGLWHLDAIMRHATNAGSVPWQVAIHSLVVEAISRDEDFLQAMKMEAQEKFDPYAHSSGTKDHNLLGKALNGLLPRRACLPDLKGEDGWTDLAWLLELNQGFYNAASLAAVSCVSDEPNPGHCWLGRPISPNVGNERLEPLVTAFPIMNPSALNVISPQTLGLRESLQRDRMGLYSNEKMKGLKWLAISFIILFILISFVLIPQGFSAFLGLFWATCIIYCLIELVAGSLYLERSGWILIPNSLWESNHPESRHRSLSAWLGHRDSNLRDLTAWGDYQLAPQWTPPARGSIRATLVDLGNNVSVDTFVNEAPVANAIMPLAVHGSGITCMVLHRPDFGGPKTLAHKVGMVNMPPYMLVQSVASGTWLIGAGEEPAVKNSGVGV